MIKKSILTFILLIDYIQRQNLLHILTTFFNIDEQIIRPSEKIFILQALLYLKRFKNVYLSVLIGNVRHFFKKQCILLCTLCFVELIDLIHRLLGRKKKYIYAKYI